MSKIIDNGWLEKEVNEAKIDMPLEDVYRHIKESYLHHKHEINAVFLPKAELIALICIQKVIAENDREISELLNIIDNGDKIDGYAYSYKTDSEGVPYINIDSVRAMLTKAAGARRRGWWISCKDKMPEDGQDVITLSEDRVLNHAVYDAEKAVFRYGILIINPTHWIPLPPMPEAIRRDETCTVVK